MEATVEKNASLDLLGNISNITDLDETLARTAMKVCYPILAIELILSIVCSIALIFIYIVIGEHRTLPGKNVISISCCLIVTYIFLTIDLLSRDSLGQNIRQAIGIMLQTTFLATFFWTNVMSYDIMKTMASITPDSKRSASYWTYFAYSWGMTFLCVIPTVVIDYVKFVPSEYKPKFGLKKCWLSGEMAHLIYFSTPVGITLIANCVFFVKTARTIVEVRNATAILAANRYKKRFRLCMKLVLIMGLLWLTEFIPLITRIYYLYAAAGMLNCLHGVCLFLIFACKKRTFKQFSSDNCFCRKKRRKQSPSLDTITTLVF